MKINENKSKINTLEMLGNVLLILHLKPALIISRLYLVINTLGLYWMIFLLYDMTVETSCSSAGRALGAVISKSRSLRNFGYKTCTKLFNSCVTMVGWRAPRAESTCK